MLPNGLRTVSRPIRFVRSDFADEDANQFQGSNSAVGPAAQSVHGAETTRAPVAESSTSRACGAWARLTHAGCWPSGTRRERSKSPHPARPRRVAPRIVRIYTLRGFESVLAGSVQVSTGTKTSLSFQDGPVFTRVHRREGPAAPRGSRARTHGTTISQPTWPGVPDRLHPAHGAGAGPATFRDPRGPRGLCGNGAECESPRSRSLCAAPANALGPSGEGPRAPWPHSLR